MWFWLKEDHPNYDMPRIFGGFIDQLVVHPVTISDVEYDEETNDEDADSGDESRPILIDFDSGLPLYVAFFESVKLKLPFSRSGCFNLLLTIEWI